MRSVCLALLGAVCALAQTSPGALDHFEKRVRPLLVEQCFECHSAKAKTTFANLRLDSRAALLRGGDSGPAAVPGKPGESLIVRALRYDSRPKMPPSGKLKNEQIEAIAEWIAAGAPWPDEQAPTPASSAASKGADPLERHWAWQPVGNSELPQVRNESWLADPVDRFLLAKLEQNGLTPAPDAAPHILLRRLFLDLTGLPPSPKDLREFEADHSPAAYERLVDRLLQSPAFGERWARHWLDGTYYADNIEIGRRIPALDAWRYRDYVIEAFNADRPYHRFLKEQIAGDQLPAETALERRRNIIATGFLALGPWALVQADKEQLRMDVVDQQIDLVGRSLLGLTLGCARCHDHKFDPVSAKDYYGLAGIFKSTQTIFGRIDGVFSDINRVPLPELPSEMIARAAETERHESRLAKLKQRKSELDEEKKRLKDEKAPELDKELARVNYEINLAEFAPPRAPRAFALQDIETPGDCRINMRGNAHLLGDEVPRNFVRVAMREPMPHILDFTSGRKELAEWIANPKNPLTARVAVNRIWHHLTGAGIVRTIDNFGLRGDAPSHPELLDHLATRFVENGWSVKKLVRVIVLSRNYRMSSEPNAAGMAADPENRWRWRANRRRLQAETIRDSMLAIAGTLDAGGGGPALPLSVQGNMNFGKPEFLKDDASLDSSQARRRTIYLPMVRKGQLPELDVLNLFNFPDPNEVTGARAVTTVPTQALYLLNSPFVREQSRALAERAIASAAGDRERVAWLVEAVLGRRASDGEAGPAVDFVQSLKGDAAAAWTRYCQALFVSNEFLYQQ